MTDYTRITFTRDGILTQIVEIDISKMSKLQASRHLRVWFARMLSLEIDNNFVVRIS